MPRFPGAAFILAVALALTTANGAEVNVYAAASLTDALKEIAVNYEKQSSDKIVFNFGRFQPAGAADYRARAGQCFFLGG